MLKGTRDETFSIPVLVREFITVTPRKGSIATILAERDVHRCFKDFWRGL